LKNINKLYTECQKKSDNDTILKSLSFLIKTSDKEYKYIASRMDIQLAFIYQNDPKWIQQKIEDFFSGENFNGLLGEIRAYGELLELKSNSLEISEIKTPINGSDFIITLDGEDIHIEVNTPQISSTKITSIEIESNISKSKNYTLKFDISSKAPYGYPTRKKDNIQYEAVSKFAQIKIDKENKQFLTNKVSILWLDLNDPMIFMFNQIDYTVPIMSFNGSVTSGFIWNAFYSKKGDNIYANYNYFEKDLIQMDFNGRFNNNSNIDFVVIDCFTHKVIFENHNSKKTIPKSLYKEFLNLHNLNNKNSYLSFMKRDELQQIIELERSMSNNIFHLYKE